MQKEIPAAAVVAASAPVSAAREKLTKSPLTSSVPDLGDQIHLQYVLDEHAVDVSLLSYAKDFYLTSYQPLLVCLVLEKKLGLQRVPNPEQLEAAHWIHLSAPPV